MTKIRLNTKWTFIALMLSICFNVLTVVLLHIGDRMRCEYANASFYLANYEFWEKTKNNKVLLYSVSDEPDIEIDVDNWTIIRRSLNTKFETSKEAKKTKVGLQNFVAHNRDAAILLAGHLLWNGDKNVGKKIIDEIAQIAPDYYFSRVKEPPIKINTLQEVATRSINGDMANQDLLEYLELQYKMRLHRKYGFGWIDENN